MRYSCGRCDCDCKHAGRVGRVRRQLCSRRQLQWHYKDAEILGCNILIACNYDEEAAPNDGSCDFITCLAYGCTNPDACNYDAEADIDNGSCTDLDEVVCVAASVPFALAVAPTSLKGRATVTATCSTRLVCAAGRAKKTATATASATFWKRRAARTRRPATTTLRLHRRRLLLDVTSAACGGLARFWNVDAARFLLAIATATATAMPSAPAVATG